jgi:3-keto-5-aminohexanoate cleavage enzyme
VTREVIIMAAPNGARKTRKDHRALPVSIADTVSEAARCQAAGACALHAHVRGDHDEHVLDAGLYRELLRQMAERAPGMLVQVTSEAVGVYTPAQQVECIQAVRPEMASMALREITSDFTDPEFARDFFAWSLENNVHIQHILYSADDLPRFLEYRAAGVIPDSHRCVLFVLGRYRADFQSQPADLDPFLQQDIDGLDWFVCAFGHQEQQCVLAAVDAGGHARIGFENNLYLPDGSLADSTAELVTSLVGALAERDCRPAGSEAARQLLGIRSA